MCVLCIYVRSLFFKKKRQLLITCCCVWHENILQTPLCPGIANDFTFMLSFTEMHLIRMTPRLKTKRNRCVWYPSKCSFHACLVISVSSIVLGSVEETVCRCSLIWTPTLWCSCVQDMQLDGREARTRYFCPEQECFFFLPSLHTTHNPCKMLQGHKSDSPWQLVCLHTTGYWICENKLFDFLHSL